MRGVCQPYNYFLKLFNKRGPKDDSMLRLAYACNNKPIDVYKYIFLKI